MKDHLADDSRNFADANARIGRHSASKTRVNALVRKVYWFSGAWAAVGAALAAILRH
jgi:hypothetical protein